MQSPQSVKLSIAGGAIGLTGGLLALNMHNRKIICEASPESSEIKPTPLTQSDEAVEDVPESIVNYKHLGFGSGGSDNFFLFTLHYPTVCGICMSMSSLIFS